jgi:transcriptional regulator NrdR family protein
MKTKDKATDLPRGLVCPRCGCRHFEVVYTRASFGAKIIRRRECRHCGKRITTWEKEIGK